MPLNERPAPSSEWRSRETRRVAPDLRSAKSVTMTAIAGSLRSRPLQTSTDRLAPEGKLAVLTSGTGIQPTASRPCRYRVAPGIDEPEVMPLRRSFPLLLGGYASGLTVPFKGTGPSDPIKSSLSRYPSRAKKEP